MTDIIWLGDIILRPRRAIVCRSNRIMMKRLVVAVAGVCYTTRLSCSENDDV
jgi:hypothetical protein